MTNSKDVKDGDDRTIADDDDVDVDQEEGTVLKASVSETLGFLFQCGTSTRILFVMGCLGAIGQGLMYPVLAYLLSNTFSTLSTAATEGLESVRRMAFTFMGLGAYVFTMDTVKTACFDITSARATRNLKLSWFRALLRQDAAYFDIYGISALSSAIGPNANRYKRGVGKQLSDGVQNVATFIGGFAFALYSNWRVALVVMSALPLVSIPALAVIRINASRSARANEAYSTAGGVAYSTVSNIRTVLSLNALPQVISHYKEATLEAFQTATSPLWKEGLSNGAMAASQMILFAIFTLYGLSLIYHEVASTGCDPSGGDSSNHTCQESGPEIFAALLGIAFAGQSVAKIGTFLASFASARTSVYPAILAIDRTVGAKEKRIYSISGDKNDDDKRELFNCDIEQPPCLDERKLTAVLPRYAIDSSSKEGLKPKNVQGKICFKGVEFSYPSRVNEPVLKNLSLDIEAGKTIALVGPSGGGKSTIVSTLLRFYDPLSGSIEIDGIDLRDINVNHLRSIIGYVGQEPKLFDTSIAQNIKYGNPSATCEQIEKAARMANAHDFIQSFPDGYQTSVGDCGSQLSGGQKQRIAIARALVSNPAILILDEATSALDNESELVVQNALDKALTKFKRTTIIIAHRLTTIRNCDVIAVISNGSVVEKGTHAELMESPYGHYRRLVQQQDSVDFPAQLVRGVSSDTDGEILTQSDDDRSEDVSIPHLEFKEVHFAYPNRPGKSVFSGFNLTVNKGETLALVGPSGGGKSTAIALLERFYDPDKGSLQYMGHDVRSLNTKWYRDQIGLVGQEPFLFHDTIANNIAYGVPGASRSDIEEAALQANAHDFIVALSEGYDTVIGEGSIGLSGGQKQRVAIARALIRKPEVLLLDESTAALDNESELIVQTALDNLVKSSNCTAIVIAHRLTTIRNADRIAFVADGRVKELGSHEELMARNGHYCRLVNAQKQNARTEDTRSQEQRKSTKLIEEGEEPGLENGEKTHEQEEDAFSLKRARKMAADDMKQLLVGAFGALLTGATIPVWGVLFAFTLEQLFTPVAYCEGAQCHSEWLSIADGLQHNSFFLALYWVLIAIATIIGNVLLFRGFGLASERLNKRVRDESFIALVRQEVGFFDQRSVASLTSELQEDATRIQTFSNEPIRSAALAVSSFLTGVVLSFVFMWPLALLGLASLPLLLGAAALKVSEATGEDEDDSEETEDTQCPGGIVVETLLNIRTVASLALEQQRFEAYKLAVVQTEPISFTNSTLKGIRSGITGLVEQWITALQLWFGGWLLFHYPTTFNFIDFLIANFAFLFSLVGLGAAWQNISDRAATEASAGRIFYLLDRQSAIDPLSEEGRKLDSRAWQR